MSAAAKTWRIIELPLTLQIAAVAAVAMLVPGFYALAQGDEASARIFGRSCLLGLLVIGMIALSLRGRKPIFGTHGQLLALLLTFIALPVFLALPLYSSIDDTTYLNAYFDMVSAVTTTGADIYADPGRLNSAVHLWRALVGWLGGLLMWVAASAILAPLSLGGFEVTAQGEPGRSVDVPMQLGRVDPRQRLLIVLGVLAPLYAGLTGILWVGLLILGEAPLVAFTHAMSVMATSGISSVGGLQSAAAGFAGEVLMFAFMVFAISRLTFSKDTVTSGNGRLDRDPEFRVALFIVIGVSLLLFLRHWVATFEIGTTDSLGQSLRAFWGGMFTVLSFMTTTGFESSEWDTSQDWSGLGTPELILMGLALIGGGVATTAGGVKLLRVYALYLSGLREMERLVHPSSVSGAAAGNRRIQKDGAFIAWIFFMLFALSIALISVTLAALGSSFEDAIVLTIAALSTTGPLVGMVTDGPLLLIELSAATKLVLCGAMVLGRLETLAIIALLTPALWRR
jgi:trk system potassium uptake protein TrkH